MAAGASAAPRVGRCRGTRQATGRAGPGARPRAARRCRGTVAGSWGRATGRVSRAPPVSRPFRGTPPAIPARPSAVARSTRAQLRDPLAAAGPFRNIDRRDGNQRCSAMIKQRCLPPRPQWLVSDRSQCRLPVWLAGASMETIGLAAAYGWNATRNFGGALCAGPRQPSVSGPQQPSPTRHQRNGAGDHVAQAGGRAEASDRLMPRAAARSTGTWACAWPSLGTITESAATTSLRAPRTGTATPVASSWT
jgi:hypothetical protein